MIKPFFWIINVQFILQNIYWILLTVRIYQNKIYLLFLLLLLLLLFGCLIGQCETSRLIYIVTNKKTNGPQRYWFNIEELRNIFGIQYQTNIFFRLSMFVAFEYSYNF